MCGLTGECGVDGPSGGGGGALADKVQSGARGPRQAGLTLPHSGPPRRRESMRRKLLSPPWSWDGLSHPGAVFQVVMSLTPPPLCEQIEIFLGTSGHPNNRLEVDLSHSVKAQTPNPIQHPDIPSPWGSSGLGGLWLCPTPASPPPSCCSSACGVLR